MCGSMFVSSGYCMIQVLLRCWNAEVKSLNEFGRALGMGISGLKLKGLVIELNWVSK